MRFLSRTIQSVPQTDDAREQALLEQELLRREEVAKRRLYVKGEQYAERNARQALAFKCPVEELPEHEKLLAYSTQINDSLTFLADRLGEGFKVEAEDDTVQQVIDAVVSGNDQIAAENDEGDVEIVTDDLIREAMIAQDVAAYVGWNPIDQVPYVEFWESEHVEFRMATTRKIEKVVRTEVVWREARDGVGVPIGGDWREVEERVEYELKPNEFGVLECQRIVFWDGDDDPVDPPEWLGIGALPWVLLRVDKRTLRGYRGEALVTDQVMMQADRYNANEQLSYLIARYNSHGNLAVTGDAATLQSQNDERVHKDVADVLTFPGGTNLSTITLPTDPAMIEHQREVLADSLVSAFGLTRVDPGTINGIGSVTGYALEILNQKSDSTFKRVARRWRQDVVSMFSLCLDVTAWKRDSPIGLLNLDDMTFLQIDESELDDLQPETNQTVVQQWWLVDPAVVYPNRRIRVEMGSGYIVDEVMIRDDFVAGLISQEEALRKRSYDDQDIARIVAETDNAREKEAQAALGETSPSTSNGTTRAGSTVATATRRPN